MDEKKILEEMAKVEEEYKLAKAKLSKAKRDVLDAETVLINAKIRKERLAEALRVNRSTVPSAIPELTLRDQDIEEFRKRNPELVAWAKERDDKRGQE
jgi:hypothetical protein